MEKKLFCCRISIILNIQGYTKGHGLETLIVMLSSSKTGPFGLVVIDKWRITFSKFA